ncbi:hypothetical protein OY671_009586, partial [Metschnikowia pulcherrima]
AAGPCPGAIGRQPRAARPPGHAARFRRQGAPRFRSPAPRRRTRGGASGGRGARRGESVGSAGRAGSARFGAVQPAAAAGHSLSAGPPRHGAADVPGRGAGDAAGRLHAVPPVRQLGVSGHRRSAARRGRGRSHQGRRPGRHAGQAAGPGHRGGRGGLVVQDPDVGVRRGLHRQHSGAGHVRPGPAAARLFRAAVRHGHQQAV